MNKEKLKTEFASKLMEIYAYRDTYSRGKIIDMAMEAFAEIGGTPETCHISCFRNCQGFILKKFKCLV